MFWAGMCACFGRPGPANAAVQRSWEETPRDRLGALQATLSDPAGARVFGRRYLASCPSAARDALELADRPAAEWPASAGDLRRMLAQSRDMNARLKQTALVDGWVLPRVEAQVCALSVLL
jgi:hypothetical protein